MQTVFSERLLAELRARHDEKGRLEVERVQVQSEDPDDDPEPAIACPALSGRVADQNVEKISPLPADQAEQTSGCWPDTGDGSKGLQSTAGTPSPPDLLNPVVLHTMPPKVAAFMLHEPREPPPWRRQETLEERAHRVQLEDCGSSGSAFPTVGSPKYGSDLCICRHFLYYKRAILFALRGDRRGG